MCQWCATAAQRSGLQLEPRRSHRRAGEAGVPPWFRPPGGVDWPLDGAGQQRRLPGAWPGGRLSLWPLGTWRPCYSHQPRPEEGSPMPRPCSICRHPERQAMDQALAANEPFRYIANRFGTSPAALHRHYHGHTQPRAPYAPAVPLEASGLVEAAAQSAHDGPRRPPSDHGPAVDPSARAVGEDRGPYPRPRRGHRSPGQAQ